MTMSTFKDSKCCNNTNEQEKSNSIFCEIKELNLGITLKGGQSFRWMECKDGTAYRGVFNNTVWTLAQSDDKLFYTAHATLRESQIFNESLSNYFRLNLSLQENLKIWAKLDSHFESYYKVGAVRILNQDVVENLFSFICSSNNNISRITGMIEKLCRLFGERICVVEDQVYYDFPTIESLTKSNVEAVLRKEGFGYRAGYISKSARKLLSLGGEKWLLQLQKENGASYEHARKSLMSLPGIGPKVADCICLMSLGHLEAIPVDTHMFQVACTNYIPHLSSKSTVTPKINEEVNLYFRNLWGPLSGWAQAIVFCTRINPMVNENRKRSSRSKRKSVEIAKVKKFEK